VTTPETETTSTTTSTTTPTVPVVELVVDDEVAACRVCGCTDDEACEGGCWWVEDPQGLGDLCSACTHDDEDDDEGDEHDGQGDVLVVAGTTAGVKPSPGTGFSAFQAGVVTAGLAVGAPVAVVQALQAGAWLSTLLVWAGVAAVMAVVGAVTHRPGGRRDVLGPLLVAGELPAAAAGAVVATAAVLVVALTGVGGGVR
jgi:hypothetical protein